MTRKDGGRGMAHLIYILYIAGFLTGVSALVGVVLAWTNRNAATAPFQSHFDWQIHIFWRGLTFLVVMVALYFLAALAGSLILGFGFILAIFFVPIGIWWFVWTILAIAKGMTALGRQEPMPP